MEKCVGNARGGAVERMAAPAVVGWGVVGRDYSGVLSLALFLPVTWKKANVTLTKQS